MSLRGIDLNLLPVLQVLLREASVTRAAASLGLSQPATSQALGRLRHMLGDPLLVKVGRTMKLTPRAEQLRPLVEQSCASLTTLLSNDAFDPAVAVRAFSIASPDYIALAVGEELIRLLRAEAPGISVRFTDTGPLIRDHILAGSLDFAIVARVPSMLRGLSIHGGFWEDLVCVVGPGHPLAGMREVTLAQLDRHPRLGVDLASHLLLEFGQDHNTEPLRIGPSHLLTLPLLAATSGSMAIVGRTLGRLALRYTELEMIELADETPPIEDCVAWSPANDSDPAHRWMRGALARILSNHTRSTPGKPRHGQRDEPDRADQSRDFPQL